MGRGSNIRGPVTQRTHKESFPMIKQFDITTFFVLGISVAGCASDADSEVDSATDDLSTLPASDAPAGTAPTAVVWGCNFGDGTAAVFVQDGPRKPHGLLHFFKT